MLWLYTPVPSTCRCHGIFLWCFVCFVLLRFRLYAFVEAAALRSIVLPYARVPIATRVSFFFLSVYLEMSLFPSFFLPSPLSLCMESTSYVLSFRIVFFLLCDHGLDFLHYLNENSVNQSTTGMGEE